jgi:hypothetical protein
MMRLLLLRFVDRFWWRTPRMRSRRMAGFARVERSSATDLRLAARCCSDPARAALYLRHAADETRHARLFHAQANRLALIAGDRPELSPRAECEALFERLGERDFLAFVHYAERRGRRQFEVHARTLGQGGLDRELAAVFEDVLADERRHERYSWDQLLALSGSAAGARLRVRLMAGWEAWRAFRRTGRNAGRAIYRVGAVLLYAACLPLRPWLPAARRGGLLPPSET